MKRKIETLLVKELDEIEAIDFVTSFPHLLDKVLFIAHDIRLEYPEESNQLIEISEQIEDLLKQPSVKVHEAIFIEIKSAIALILKQMLDIED